jgi:hypothetical protein
MIHTPGKRAIPSLSKGYYTGVRFLNPNPGMTKMSPDIAADTLHSINHIFRSIKKLGDGALDQLSYEEMQRSPGPEMNSIAVIVHHMHGNMRSRWSDFLTSDGEKPWRDRDGEFNASPDRSREELLSRWNHGWACVFNALDPLKPEDLSKSVTVRGQPHSVVEAAHRQISHYSYHVGQIVLLAKLFKSSGPWETLSIPRGESKQYKPSGLGGEAERRN